VIGFIAVVYLAAFGGPRQDSFPDVPDRFGAYRTEFRALTAADSLPDTPANHWIYETLSHLKRAGLLRAYDRLSRGSAGGPSALMIARHVIDATNEMTYIAGTRDSDLYRDGWRIHPFYNDKSGHVLDRVAYAKELLGLTGQLQALIDAFASRIRTFETTPEDLTRQVRQAKLRFEKMLDIENDRFPDVADNHWAYESLSGGKGN